MKILIAEDDFTSRAVLTGVLTKSGYEVMETLNGNEAWQTLQQPDSPRLVILDWMMPGLDGPEVLRRVRAEPTDRPPYILMLTAKGEKSDIIAGLDIGANDYLAKPFDSAELLARLEVGRRLLEMQDALANKIEELNQSQDDLRVLAARLHAVREDERAILSRELHDSFGQCLTALQIDLMAMDRHLQSASAPDLRDVSDRLVAMVPQIERLAEHVQTLCTSLRPNVLFELGLLAAIEWQTEDTSKRSGLHCSMSLPAEELPLDKELALAIFRIVQESLTNIVRHAQATHVTISLHNTGGVLALDILDDGRGFVPKTSPAARTYGLLGMRERAVAFGGTVEFFNAPDKGAAVQVRMPLPCAIRNPQPTESL